MRSFILLSLAPLALANDVSKRAVLQPRQGSDAFIPETTTVYNCPYPLCGGEYCVYPSEGDTCCSEGYGCPGGSFCLTQGYCCPDGDDPATCARQFGLTLPSTFKPGQTVALSLSVSPSTSAPLAPSSPPVAPSPSTSPNPSSTPAAAALLTPASTPSSSSSKAPFPSPVTNATIVPPSTATGKSAPGGTSVVPFTGGAMRVGIDGVVGAIVVGGAVGLLI